MNRARPINEEPFATYAVAAILSIVTIAGAIVALVNPDALSAGEYLGALGWVAIGAGLLGIGRGIQDYGVQRAGAEALKLAHERGERHRPYDPDTEPAGSRFEPY